MVGYRKRSKKYGGLTISSTDRKDGKQTNSYSYGTTKNGGVKTTTSQTTGGKTRVTRTFKDASGYVHKTQQTLNKTVKFKKPRKPRAPKPFKFSKPKTTRVRKLRSYARVYRSTDDSLLSGFGLWFIMFVIAILIIGSK